MGWLWLHTTSMVMAICGIVQGVRARALLSAHMRLGRHVHLLVRFHVSYIVQPWILGRNCSHPIFTCLNAHVQAFQVTSWLGPIAASAAALAAVFATAVIGAGSHWHAARVIGSGVVCAAGLLIAAWAWQLRQKLVFVDYVHQDHH